jgi:MtrB/PioB family decaheme-associated outer membrane protein
MTASGMARIVAVAGALGLSAMAGVASAQTSIYGLQVDGYVELGGRVYIDEPPPQNRAKLEEYRDLDQQPFGAFGVRLFRPDQSLAIEAGGNKIGQDDQEFFLGAGKPGLWRFDFDWNQIPHVYSTDARLLAIEPSPGVFTLPSPRPNLKLYNAAPQVDEIKQQWDVGTFGFTLTPTPDLDILLKYTRIKKDGEIPFGVPFGSPGNNFFEVLQRIDQTIHDFRATASWVGDGWQLQFAYALSVFDNALDATVADNPCFKLSAAVTVGGCAGDANGAPQRGQVSQPPSNIAHTLSLSGGINLPMRTRVTANISYSLRLQDDTFLPHTINPSISSPLLTLPQQNLDGMVGIFLANLNATSRPLPPLTLSGRFRVYDFDDMTDELIFPGHVVDDRAPVVNEARRAVRFPYTKYDVDLEGRWRFGAPVAATGAFGWERWDRVFHREAPTSDEYSFKLAVDTTPFDWLLARLSYRPSFRRINEYNTFAHLAHTVVEDVTPDAQAQSQSTLLRKFDEADRNRQRVDLFLQFTPTDVITITPNASYWYDDYYNSPLGLQNAENWSAGFDVTWNPLKWLSVTAGYVYETIDQQQRSRNREVSGSAVIGPPDFDWVSHSVDTYHTVHAGLTATLIPDVLDWLVDIGYSYGDSEIKTFNPVKPTGGNASQQSNATAKPFPDVTNELIHVGTALRYRFAKAWYLSLAYLFEQFTQTNFRTNTLNPFQTQTSSIYLGNDLKDYTAQIITLALGYRFQ